MSVRVEVPIRIRVDPLALLERQDDLEDALAAAVGRALKNSREVVLAQRGGYVGVQVNSPEFTWSGDGLVSVPGGVRSEIVKLLTNVLERTTQSAGIYGWSSDSKKISIPLPKDVSEVFDGNRYDSDSNTYAIPTYQPTSQPSSKPPIPLPVQGISKVIPPLISGDEALSRQLRSADVKERRAAFSISLTNRLQDGDIKAFRLALLAIRPDNADPTARVLEELTYFAKRHPQEFLRILRILLNDKATEIAQSLQRTSQFPSLAVAKKLLEEGDIAVVAGIVLVAREISIARQLLQEREQLTKGTNRLIGLVDALIEIRRQLHSYLKGQQDKIETDSSILDKIDSITDILPLFSGTFAAIAGQALTSPNSPNIYDLEVDLLENYHWISRILEKIRQIDSQIALYKLLYGKAADELDESEVLNTARIGYLTDVIGNPFPMASNITKMIQERERFSDDWIGQAADKKLERLKQAIKNFKDDIEKLLKQGVSQIGGGYRRVDTEYNGKLNELLTSVAELEKEINSVKPQQRDINYLNQVRRIEQQIPLVKVRLSLLPYWFAFLQLMGFVDKGTGFASERRYWHSVVDPEGAEVIKQYTNPDYAELGNLQRTWKSTIENLRGWIKIALGQDVAFTLALTVVAIVVTAGVGSMVSAEVGTGTVVVFLAEAGAFTVVTTLGKALLLDKPTDLGDVIGEFTENALLFATFRALTSGAALFAKAIFPERALVQFGIIFGAPVLASALPVSIPLIVKKVETGEWPEETGTVILSTILITTVAALLGGSKLREALRAQVLQTKTLRALALQDMLTEIELLSKDENVRRKEIQQFISNKKYPSKQEFDSLKSRGVSTFNDLKRILDGMANNFTKKELASLGLTPAMVKDLAKIIPEIGSNIENAIYKPGISFQRALLPPNEVIGTGLVPTASGTFEYNPSSPSLQLGTLRTKLLQAGYQVTDRGGGVLQLTGAQGESPTYLLLPARADVTPASLVSLVKSPRILPRRGWTVLQQQNAVPPLEANLASIASSDPQNAELILAGIGRYLEASNTQELQGIFHFLQVGGSARALAVTLGNTRNRTKSDVLATLQQFNDLTANDARGVDAIVSLRGTGTTGTDSIVGIGENFKPARSVYGAINDIAPFTESGLNQVIEYLARGGNSQNVNQAGLGSLLASKVALAEHPGSRIEFEVKDLTAGGRIIRVLDFKLKLPIDNPLQFIEGEVKEVTQIRILEIGSSINQFARDIVRQANNPPPQSFRPLARLLWLIRRPETKLESTRQQVKDILRRAFDENILKNHPQRKMLLQDFEQHFDEIVRFF